MAAAHPVAVFGGHTDALQPRGTSRRAFLWPRHTPSRCLEATPMPYSHAAHLGAPSYGRGTSRRDVWRPHRCPTATRHISARLPTAAAHPVAMFGGHTDALQPRGTSRRAFLRPRHIPSRCLEATPMPYSHAAHLVAPSYGRGTPRRGVWSQWRGHRCP